MKIKSMAGKIVIYSACPIMADALKVLCRPRTKQKQMVDVISVNDPDKLIDVLTMGEIHSVVLDMVAHNHACWIYQLRMGFPEVPFIITQRRILFSDRVLAEYLGMIWLREYDAILAAYPEFLLTEVVSHEIFSGPEAGGTQILDETVITPELFCDAVNKRLCSRLQGIFSGGPVTNAIIEGLINGVPVNKLGGNLSMSSETIYQYRKKIIKALQIQHYGREFARSLKIDFQA
ncbi:hypothetical protein PJP40_004640 [Salmonella enterica]|nr:hypothetical protein [Salmonella enterica]